MPLYLLLRLLHSELALKFLQVPICQELLQIDSNCTNQTCYIHVHLYVHDYLRVYV